MKKILLLSLLGVLFLFTQCKTQGCTDQFADNYDTEAEEDDGSCEYSVELIFYLNDSRKSFYDNKDNFYAPFHLYIDGEKIGELSVSAANFQTYQTAPTCETTTGGILKHKYTMTSKTGDVTVTIKDQMDNDHGSVSANVAISEGECKAVLL